MSNTDRLTDLRLERDELVSAMRSANGKLVKRIIVRGREVEYADAMKYRQYLDKEIDLEERKASGRRGPSRNKARLGRA